MPLLSVIICTRDPRADFLQHTLDALRAQTLPLDEWELLLVDNGSTEPLAKNWDLSWHPGARHVREDELGVRAARLRSFREFTGDLLVFVDDDNALESHYLERVRNLAREWPQVGIFGGSQVGAFEQEPAPDTVNYLTCLAVRTISRVAWANIKGIWETTPFGAGSCIRRDLALKQSQRLEKTGLRKLLGGTGPDGLRAGEDIDFAWSACDFGYGMLVTPNLVLTHHISKSRLEKSYLLRTTEGARASEVVLREIHGLQQHNSRPLSLLNAKAHIAVKERGFTREIAFAMERGKARGLRLVRAHAE